MDPSIRSFASLPRDRTVQIIYSQYVKKISTQRELQEETAMASSLPASIRSTCNLKSTFLGERCGIQIIKCPTIRAGGLTKPVECKLSRIGKKPIEVPSNVTITLDGQDLKVKGPLGELSRTYPREITLAREESGIIKVSKAVDTRRANQMHGLFRQCNASCIRQSLVKLLRSSG